MSKSTTVVTFPSRIGAATANESSPFALASFKIEGNDKRVWSSATDCRIAASVLWEGHTDETRLVPAELVPRTKKAMCDGSATVERNGQCDNVPDQKRVLERRLIKQGSQSDRKLRKSLIVL